MQTALREKIERHQRRQKHAYAITAWYKSIDWDALKWQQSQIIELIDAQILKKLLPCQVEALTGLENMLSALLSIGDDFGPLQTND